ncbi:glutathione-disulfide reductase [Rhodovulum sulfidophilum]|uniref:Glutathione reductase n=1 Tax=Rhodovulum sulfidophilum TaxID=35806 RepID=A0ABS1RUQ2_RHOSU|nr:glutathione-disulfide reductase [Rhodovulum sulfidophilum]ANB35713.1 NADPH-glutathione reductase [Rhodovulum sulfidophilum DSM 1374]ANB39535.1 NADPH-glutathione reductase [Rhodovulum sulfidophilum]MBL3609801.1 glutathione-disulfide reductase [Rhodovulum sulfidophilum]MCE8457551.1 glutathione-disulfide reductase [Rhodovulum sulfidophilum]MCW2302828.1 glutathione reductase (NADPH) [Rhodovulum sulfidophilum]
MSFDYDLFVIGGGSGGVRAARLAASEAGARVGLAEEYRMGGTCVIRGCVPKKLMVYASGFAHAVEDARAYGWQVHGGEFDWSLFKARLDDELTRLEGVYRGNLERAGVEIFDSRAVLADPHTVRLADGTEKTARHILIATGGRPFVPEFPGSELAITSNDVFLFESLPKRILIVGGGYIACEFACILNGLGVEVTQFYRGAQILRGFDDEARGHIAGAMCAQGVDLRVGCNVQRIDRVEDGLWVKATDGGDAVFDAVLFATGRRPNTDGMGLEEAGIALGANGAVAVDEWSQSSVPSVYAVGDVTDRIALTPVAIREGAAFVETVFKGNPTRADHDLVPGAVFTRPEYGSVGLTEEEARGRGPIEVYSTAFRPMQSGFAGRPDRVMMKLIVAAESRKVLGCHIVADQAGEMIQLAAVAIKMGATKEDFDRTVAVHPTMAEELVTMKVPVRTG